MKVDPHSVYLGMGVLGAVAGSLAIWGRRLLQVFGICLATFLGFELFCFYAGTEALVPVWWAVHFPSAWALGADEILERHGALVSTAFHLGDYVLWSALLTGVVAICNLMRRDENHDG